MVESYTMLALNADRHALMNQCTSPTSSSGPEQQDKRSVVPIERDQVETWLNASPQAAAALVRLAPAKTFDARPAGP